MEVILSLAESRKTPMFTTGTVLLLAVVLANAAVCYREVRSLVRNNESVVHSFRVINELEATLSLMKDVETGYRGYVLTGNPAYLNPYSEAANEVSRRADGVANLTRDNPDLQLRLLQLRQAVREKLDVARNVVELEQAGNQRAAMEMVNSNVDKEKMDQIRQLIANMQADENRLLQARSGQSALALREAQRALLLASLVALVFVLAFYFLAKHEIKERVRMATAIRARESWLDTTLRSIGDGVIAIDANGEVAFMNRVAEKLLASTSQECHGKTITEVFPIFDELTGMPAEIPIQKAIDRGTIAIGEHIVLRNHKDQEMPIEDSVAPIFDLDGRVTGAVLVFRDVTAKRMAQESARRSEKLAATGRLAATIAHEINNPLEAATNLVYLARRSAARGEETSVYLDRLDHEIARAAHITKKTLSFYRDSSKPVAVNLASLLEEILALYGGRIRSKGIQVNVDCPKDLDFVAFRGEVVQITSNLICNAIDALGPHGFLELSVQKEKDGIKFEVEDSGAGIPAEVQEKIFEPFFTTKKDVGTGLGLWVVKDLIEKQGGTISVVSPRRGTQGGTCFSVFLPSLSQAVPVS
jgi:PAS domain S-box-containing protein